MLSNAFRADIEESGRVGGKGEREKGKLRDKYFTSTCFG